MTIRALIAALMAIATSSALTPAAAQVVPDSVSVSVLTDAHRAVVGCYWVELGPWQDLDSTEEDERYFRIAPWIRLDTVPGSSVGGPRPGLFSLHPTQGRRRDEFAHWRLLAAGDSLRLAWSTGYGGVDVSAVVSGDGLLGRLRAWTDVLSMIRPTRSFEATRIPCTQPEGAGG